MLIVIAVLLALLAMVPAHAVDPCFAQPGADNPQNCESHWGGAPR